MSEANGPGEMPPAEKQFEILSGGTEQLVTFTNGQPQERVKVRKIAIRDIGKLSDVLGKEVEEVAFICERKADWVESLDDDSFEALIEEGRRLNFSRFAKWAKRQQDLLRALGQGDAIQKIMSAATEKAARSMEALGRR